MAPQAPTVNRKALDAQLGQVALEQRLQQVASQPRNAIDPQEREAVEAQVVEMKGELARQESRTAQLRADETAAYNALSGEQQRWSAFNERLETIERSLSQAAVTPP